MNNLELFNQSPNLTKEQLLTIFELYLADVDVRKGKPTLEGFAEWSKQINGNSKKNAITRRFASKKGGNDGWSNVMRMYGRTVAKRPKWPIDEMLEIGKRAYDTLGKFPRARDMDKTELCSSVIIQHFRRNKYGIPNEESYGGITKFNYLMSKKYDLKKTIEMPYFNSAPHKYRGDDLRKFEIEVENFGLERGPVNEQGVVALFSKIHTLIGFPTIIYITQRTTPDCEASCNIGSDERYVSIDFKYQTRIYISDEDIENIWNKIDYIVCWKDNSQALKKRLKSTRIISLKNLLESKDKELVKKINKHFAGHAKESGK